MESTEAPKYIPEDEKIKEVYQEYLQKCCEVGQIEYNLDQLDSQQRELEKNLEVTKSAVKKAANKHRDLQKEKFSKIKTVSDSKIPEETKKTEKLEMDMH